MNIERDIDPALAAIMEIDGRPVAFLGKRKGARPVGFTVDCTITEDAPVLAGDAIAPGNSRIFNLTFPRVTWLDATPPQIGEWTVFDWAGERITAKVAEVNRMPDGDYVLVAIFNPSEKGRPVW